jgi:hypothetical protein
VREVILNHGLFSSLYTDRGRNSRITPEAGGKVDKVNLTQFGRVMKTWVSRCSRPIPPRLEAVS